VAVYVCGFLITSLHQANYGFTETNPFRPHIISAGAWFLLFTGIPIMMWIRYRIYSKTFMGFLVIIFPFYALCFLLSGIPSEIFELPRNNLAFYTRQSLLVANVMFGFTILMMVAKYVKLPTLLLPYLSLGLTIYFVLKLIRHLLEARDFQRGSIVLWFFCITLAAELLYQNWVLGDLRVKDWAANVVWFLVALWLFATYYYPNIKRSWGGGKPISVVLWFTKESAVKPGQQIPVRLIDESDVGFYILGQNEQKALFVPRSAVSAVYYSDKASDSVLLK
jgi:hypothetical protein